ncbi:condensin-2 complex subunit H2 isoform X1 [Amborella trichopoda]|uniref:Condensin-2 complex subunit H2 n=1 Tax=Amborella trichopoda TaxID=13333 RepID=W1P0G4_AMBTC|nr:condensin-2 complex subunit H2 isoform X1 [Amborella trichopoda]ERN03322.1 hypothetical protein AMTR_s00003p00238520 [Amborella trichopoda]|eukprot:XP_020521091.1 condensin-2 complex subunit H2 isoform X1 [Amborella trichopoda]
MDENERRFQFLQPNRDLESNWALDVAKQLEEYLLEICLGPDLANGHVPINFAEAALLLQGSIQIYSRKVEYLYSLVLHALEFISQKSRQDQQEKSSIHPDGSDADAIVDDENEEFLSLDDVPVEANINLDEDISKDDQLSHFVKPPASLLVLEGDHLDIGDSGDLTSYQIATSSLHRDFLLLDPCDAESIDCFLKVNKSTLGNTSVSAGSSLRSKSRRSFFQSPSRRSASAQKSGLGKSQDIDPNASRVDSNNKSPHGQDLPEDNTFFGGDLFDEDDVGEDSDDDPWKPLNPHEPGTLKVKPFKKGNFVRARRVSHTEEYSISLQFPVAKLHGTISPEFAEALEALTNALKNTPASHSPPPFEKLRQTLVSASNGNCGIHGDPVNENEDFKFENGFDDFEDADIDLPNDNYKENEAPLQPEQESVGGDAFVDKDLNARASLEDLCRAHLDALLASIAESEKQTELAARVSTWKQKIEHNLEEQDSHPPFDIHAYGERLIEKLSLDPKRNSGLPFTDIVGGQEKHEVARSFSALLQLVNNGNVVLDKVSSNGAAFCFSAANPFYVRLLSSSKKHEEMLSYKAPSFAGKHGMSLKRLKSPLGKGCQNQANEASLTSSSFQEVTSSGTFSHSNSKSSLNTGRVKCTPEGKRRRKSRLTK